MAPHAIIVAPSVPANNLQEFIAHARANPGRLEYASSGNGSIQHVGGVLFSRAIGAEMVHVPYRGAAPPCRMSLAGALNCSSPRHLPRLPWCRVAG
jgi:tripartite-type tricarboxylate transporter receptor subunit TctC